MEIIEKVKSFEDACKVLGIEPVLPDVSMCEEKDRKSIVAFYKLTIIIRALNEGWEPNWNDWSQYKYFAWFYVDAAGLVCANTNFTVTATIAILGSRLGFKTDELADYAKDQFKDLYIDYLFLPDHE